MTYSELKSVATILNPKYDMNALFAESPPPPPTPPTMLSTPLQSILSRLWIRKGRVRLKKFYSIAINTVLVRLD